MKKLLSLICIFMLIIRADMIFAESMTDIVVEAESYVTGSGVRKYSNRGTGEVISINVNGSASYGFNITKSGRYELSVNYATSSSPDISVTLSERNNNVTLSPTGGNNVYGSFKAGTFALSEGEKTLEIVAQSVGFMIDYFTLTYVGEYEEALSDENKFEAEANAPEEMVIEDDGRNVVKMDEASVIETDVNVFSPDVFKLYITAKAEENCEFVIYLNDEIIFTNLFGTSEKYITAFAENIRIPVGKSKIRIEAKDGSAYVDYIELIKNTKTLREYEKSILEAENYDDSSGDITASGAAPRYISFSGSKWVSFNVDITNSGKYKLSANGALSPDNGYPYATVGVYVGSDETEVCRGNIEITDSWVDFKNFSLGSFVLPEGETTLLIKVLYAASHIDSFCLEYLGGDCELDTVYTDYDILANDTHLPRGTDRFTLLFNQKISQNSINDTTVTLESAGEKYPLQFTVNDNVVDVDLKKSLEYDGDYVLTVSGVKDEFGGNVYEKQYLFTSDGIDDGVASLEITQSVIDYNNVIVKGIMYSKNNVPISDRKTELIFEDNTVLCTYSGNDGIFEFNWTVPDETPVGIITVSVLGDYIVNATETELLYLSESFEETILSEIKASESAEDTEKVFRQNETALDINLSYITQGADGEKIFSHLIGGQYDRVYELLEDLERYSLLEKINGASSEAVVEDILSDEEKVNLLQLDFEKISDIVINRQSFLNSILELDSIASLSELREKINETTDLYACEEFNKNTARVAVANKSVYIGEGAKIILGFKEMQENVKMVEFIISSQNKDFLDGVNYQETAKGQYSLKTEDEKLILKFDADIDESSFKDIATVTLGATDEKGEYEIKISAEIVYDIDKPYTFTYKCEEENVTIDVVKRKSTSTGGGGMQSSRLSGGGSAVNIPSVSDKENSDVKENETYKFTDVSDTFWAKDYIYALLEKGIISESADKKFNPDANIKREEFVKMMVIALDIYDENAKADAKDIKGNEWYASYIGSAQKAGLVNGRDDGTFGVGENIKREDMATLLFRAAGEKQEIESKAFADDKDIALYAKTAVYSMRANGMISGFDDNTFGPKLYTSRSQAAKIIYMMTEVVQ